MVRSMADSEFIPHNSLMRIFSRWWILLAMSVLGGTIGWAFHFFYPPVYEATSTLTVTMEFTQVELSQYEQDYAFNIVDAIINSSEVTDRIVTNAQLIGISISQTRLAKQMFLERRQSVWELHIRDQDPHVSAELANIWAQVAIDVLNAALNHAMHANQLQTQIDLLNACLPFEPGSTQLQATPRPITRDCGRYSLVEIDAALKSWTDELVQEKGLTQGILPVLEFAQTGNALIPETPVLYNQAGLTLAGAMIGFIISLWMAGIQRPRSSV
jgi:hypothetical protein